ncbi:MAG: ComEA family DNA-binding protein [Trueperaceae bacterium]|nr:ComEA family DNA-binding protein [Trueperaceae bacterium]
MSPKTEAYLTYSLIVFCVGLALVNLAPRLSVRQVEITLTQPDVTVSVDGAVRNPGVYTLPWGARVGDLIERAGGLSTGAESSLVNRAEPLDEGSTVYVPFALRDGGDERISINSGSVADLESLPGIGPALSARIIAGRPYASVNDLQRISGIGPATLERLRPLVKL